MQYVYRVNWIMQSGHLAGYEDVQETSARSATNFVLDKLASTYPDKRVVMVSCTELRAVSE